MVKIFTVREMVAAERAADTSGNSYASMMEKAGKSVSDAIRQRYFITGQKITILVGPGNNGGDGLVAGRYLAEAGAEVTFYLNKTRKLEEDQNLARIRELGLHVILMEEDINFQLLRNSLMETDILIDGLLGTGVSRPIRGNLAELFRKVQLWLEDRKLVNDGKNNQNLIPITRPISMHAVSPHIHDLSQRSSKTAQLQSPIIVAIDCPSGMNCDTGSMDPLAFPAHLTVTFAGPKRGHFMFPGATYCGELVVGEIGIDPALPEVNKVKVSVATDAWMRSLLPERQSDGHKGTFGWILIAAGSSRYWGAPALAGRAAYRVGAGLVALAVPSGIRPTLATLLPEATYPTIEEPDLLTEKTAQIIVDELRTYQALLVGPGLHKAMSFIEAIFDDSEKNLPPVVVDADGLNMLAQLPGWHKRLPGGTILTPHIGEMARLIGADLVETRARERVDLALEKSASWNCILVLKGAFTVVASPDGRCAVLPFANPVLATAGSGDVLSGIIVGLLGQRLPPFEAAVLGGYLHCLAASLSNVDAGILASEIADWVPEALNTLKDG